MVQRLFSTQQDCQIRKKYDAGKTLSQLAKQYGCSISTIRNAIIRAGGKSRSQTQAKRQSIPRIPSIREPEWRYWLGFLLADGNIYYPKDKRSAILQIGLRADDIDHLKKLKNFITSKRKITYYAPTNSCYFSISSNELTDHLNRYFITEKKSSSARVHPKLKYDRHFWRGVIDGDGYICIDNRGYPRINIVGTYKVCRAFVEFAKKYDIQLSNPKPHASIYKTGATCSKARKLLDIIYSGNDYALYRKKKIAMKILSIKEVS